MYLLPPEREDELFGAGPREPQQWCGWPERPVIGDRVHLRERGINLRCPVGFELEGSNGEQAIVVETHSGSPMRWGTAVCEIVALALEAEASPYPRSRVSSVGE